MLMYHHKTGKQCLAAHVYDCSAFGNADAAVATDCRDSSVFFDQRHVASRSCAGPVDDLGMHKGDHGLRIGNGRGQLPRRTASRRRRERIHRIHLAESRREPAPDYRRSD